MMPTLEDFWKELRNELIEFAEYSWKTYKDAAIKDGKAFVEKNKADLDRWIKLLASGALNRDDFEWLIVGKKDLTEMYALKQAGISKVALDRFINGLIDTIVATAFKSIKI
jgi:hypothetical protein